MENEPLILGIIAGEHSSGVSLIRGTEILYALEEERFNRIKAYKDFHSGVFRYPKLCLEYLVKQGIDFDRIKYFTSFFDFSLIKDVLSNCIGYDNINKDRFVEQDHHKAHCSLAYFLSGFKNKSLVISIDGSGDNMSARFYIGSDGCLEYIHGIDTSHKSLGHYYIALTELLGFKRLKDEGKIVGLAGHGTYDEDIYQIFNHCIRIDGLSTDDDNYDLGQVYIDMHYRFFKYFKSRFWKSEEMLEQIAYNGQLVFENKILELLGNFHGLYPNIKNIAVSGGVFANVKLNKRINELAWFDEVFVSPPMGDEGLSLGCALLAHQQSIEDKTIFPIKLNDVFLGAEYNEEEIETAAQEVEDLEITSVAFDMKHVVSLLLDQQIIGLYQGRTEFGPRALGNRSIIADPRSPDMYKKINDRLQRNDYMPFAPAVLDEDADRIFEVNKSRYTAEFMTMCYNTRPQWAVQLPAVVHPVDYSARIQIVTEDSNRLFFDILSAYKQSVGFGCLVNTSFNVHGEPIVNSPKEAFEHLKNGTIDVLVTPEKIYWKTETFMNYKRKH